MTFPSRIYAAMGCAAGPPAARRRADSRGQTNSTQRALIGYLPVRRIRAIAETDRLLLVTVKAGDPVDGLVWIGRGPAWVKILGGGFMLFNDAGGDAPVFAGHDATVFA
jgi:hypothetical protein